MGRQNRWLVELTRAELRQIIDWYEIAWTEGLADCGDPLAAKLEELVKE